MSVLDYFLKNIYSIYYNIYEEVLFTLCNKSCINLYSFISLLTNVLDLLVKTALNVLIFPGVIHAVVKQVFIVRNCFHYLSTIYLFI